MWTQIERYGHKLRYVGTNWEMWSQTERCDHKLRDVGTNWERLAQNRTYVHIQMCVHEQINVLKLRGICTKWEECAQHDVCVHRQRRLHKHRDIFASWKALAETERCGHKLGNVCTNTQVCSHTESCVYKLAHYFLLTSRMFSLAHSEWTVQFMIFFIISHVPLHLTLKIYGFSRSVFVFLTILTINTNYYCTQRYS